MTNSDLVRWSRDGDQFHYVWAARQCVQLLSRGSGLAAVSIEGASAGESEDGSIEAGEELIDVGLYYGAEARSKATAIHYVQLKHSTRRSSEPWTASGLKSTLRGFGKRYLEMVAETSADDVSRRFQFRFTTNRPFDLQVEEALSDLASGLDRHPSVRALLLDYSGLDLATAPAFFKLFTAEGQADDLWVQRNLLAEDLRAYLPDADRDGPIQLKDLVSRKASSEFSKDPVIRRYDVLHALKVGEDDLFPAPNLIQGASETFAREQEADILAAVLRHVGPTVLHADGGVGKSMMALRLAATLPPGSQAVVYDCFGDGMYRSAHNWRHRHQDAFTQIANELAGRGLCHPLIPTTADPKAWVRAFRHRLAQAATTVRSAVPDAVVCIIIDAADNAEMAAVDNGEAASFVRDLIAMPLPDGIRLVFTCRSHRRDLLNAPAGLQNIELQPFSLAETITHLRRRYQAATEAEAAEFRHLSSANPRVQALAMDRGLPIAEMLQALGPDPTTIEAAIGELLASAIAELKIRTGRADAQQIDSICEGLAVLRPLIPIPVLEQLTGIDGGAIRSFAYDLGRPLLVRGDTMHFMDEPAETWFRETFTPQAAAFDVFIERLRPLAKTSAYVAGMLPQLLLEAGRHDELVELALSDDALPTDNPLERRDVELRRLLFALKASLKRKKFLPAAKLALKVAGEAAGESRQISILKSNTHLGARLLAPDRILDLASRRLFGAQWMGSHHAYEAVLLSGTADFTADAASRLRMAMDWLMAWARRIDDEDPNSGSRIEVTDEDRAALALASLRLKGPKSAARFLRRWRYRPISFTAGGRLADQLVDLGEFEALSDLAAAARNDAWLLLALAHAAREANRTLPAEPLARLLKLLESPRVQLKESNHWNEQWHVLQAVTAAVELALVALPPEPERWAALLRRYLPAEPPHELSSRLPYDRSTLLRPYALEAALRGAKVEPADVAPKDVRREITRSGYSSYSADAETFLREVGGLLPWVRLRAEIRCGRPPANLIAAMVDCLSESEKAGRRGYREDYDLRNAVAKQWLNLLAETGTVQPEAIASFKAWRDGPGRTMWPATLTSLVRVAARTKGLQDFAIDLAVEAHGLISLHREDAQTRTASYLDLARAVFTASSADATAYFDEAVAIASRIGDENLDRWAAFLHLAGQAAEARTPRPETAYRFSRMAELTYEYVQRDKHFPWHDTTEALSDLCPTSALAILGRWRDRRFGRRGRLLPIVIERLVSQGRLAPQSLVALSGLEMEWDRATDLTIFLEAETEQDRRRRGTEIAYRYLRLGTTSDEAWNRLRDLVAKEDWPLGDMERIHLINRANAAIEAARTKAAAELAAATSGEARPASWERPPPDWKEIFAGADVTTPEGLTLAFERMRSGEPPFETETFWREAAARTPTGREAELMRAIADGPDFSIFAFHYALKQMPAAWQGRPAYRRSLRETVLKLCERDPVHVYRRGFNRLLPFDDLIAASVLTDADIVDSCLTGFAASLEVLDAGELFRLLDPLASRLTPVEADEALHYGLDLMEPNLKPEDGDGPWSADLAPPDELLDALAGCIWAGLGEPDAAERWSFAHVIRNVVELGWDDLLVRLAACVEAGRSAPFTDTGLHFYVWHARQWMLIGLYRGARERPEALRPFLPWLRVQAGEPHVLIADLAARCLILWAKTSAGASEDLSGLAGVNAPIRGEIAYEGWRDPEAEDPSAPPIPEEDAYYFGLDVGQYWFAPMGRVFGLSETAVERRALDAVRTRMAWSGQSWRDDKRHERRLYGDGETRHSHGSRPRVEDLGAYHGYHSMMLTAGILLREYPVGRRTGEAENDFEDWIKSYRLTRPDGGWLFDRADPALFTAPHEEPSQHSSWTWGIHADDLAAQLRAPDGRTVVWGSWETGSDHRRETTSVRSALVTEASAEALLAALQTAPDPGRHFLPAADRDEDVELADGRLFGWIEDRVNEAGMDEFDPWAERLRYPAAAPSEEIAKRLGLKPEADGRIWRGQSGDLLSESWTVHQGYGREAETVPGWRLSISPSFVPALLGAYPGHCLILGVKMRRPPARWERDAEPYPWPYFRYFLMGSDGRPRSL